VDGTDFGGLIQGADESAVGGGNGGGILSFNSGAQFLFQSFDFADAGTVAQIGFRNIYDTVENIGQLKVQKVVEGGAYEGDEEFEFTLAKAEAEEDELGNDTRSDQLPEEVTATTTAGEVATFGSIGYVEDGTYYYTITETVPDEADRTPGMSYATDPVWARVDVPSDSALDPEVWYGDSKEAVDAKAEAGDESEEQGTITNAFGTGSLRVTKSLRGVPAEFREKEFAVTVTNAAGEYVDENGAVVEDGYAMAVSAASPLEIDGLPLGTYTVTELSDDREIEGDDVDEDRSITTETVEVTADNDVENPAEVELVNVYGTVEDEVVLKVTKKVEGDGYAGKDEFTFKLARLSDEIDEAEESDEDESTDDEGSEEEAADDESSDDTDDGLDSQADNIDGDESGDEEESDDYADDEDYEDEDYDDESEDGEDYDGDESADEGYEYGDVLPSDTTATAKAGGTAEFGAITYTEPGDYFYTIREAVPDQADRPEGMSYDTSTYLALVSVGDDLSVSGPVYAKFVGEETFDALYEALESGDEGAAELTVTNRYERGTVSVPLKAAKRLEGRALKAGEFSFQLRDGDGKALQTKTNLADGRVAFDEISYTAADEGKTFRYTITEVKGDAANVTYDTHAAKVSVKVETRDGVLTAIVTYDGSATNTFVNKYTVPSVPGRPTATPNSGTTPRTTTSSSPTTTVTTTKMTTPNEGDSTSFAAAISLAVLGLAAVTVGRRRRRA
jgi:pilin isopeptide linkage protein